MEKNATDMNFPACSGIHQLFEEQVRQTPEKIAVTCEGSHLSYYTLNARANQLAHALQRMVPSGNVVGLCCERSLEMIISVLAILKAGCSYCPLDPSSTLERIQVMIEDSQADLVLTHPSPIAEKLMSQPVANQARVISLEDLVFAKESTENMAVMLDEEMLAYVIYTSGSTGRPKGTLLPHRVLTNLIYWHISTLLGGVRILQHSPLSFDSSVHEIFTCWASGGTLIILPEQARLDVIRQVAVLEEEAIEKVILPAMLLQHIVLGLSTPGRKRQEYLKEVITTGEQLLITQAVRDFFASRPTCRLHNHYGPSETHVVTAYTLPKSPSTWSSSPAIGYPIANTQIYLLDSHMQEVPPDAAGEVYIGGANLGHGYLGQGALTAERFVPNPFTSKPGTRLYRTGDLAHYQQDGSILYLGRIDHQTKIRGHRVEPGEVEAALYRHPDVYEAVVQTQQNEAGERQLVAHIVPDPQCSPFIEGLPRLALPNGLMITYTVKAEIEALYREIFEDLQHTPPWITIAEGDCIVDAGAHIGLFSLFLGLQGKPITIYAFEPIPALNQRLRLNTLLYGVNIKNFACGLSDREGIAPFTYYPQASVWSGMYPDLQEDSTYFKLAALNTNSLKEDMPVDSLMYGRFEEQRVHCPLRTLSSVIHEHAIERIDLLKIDVERSELDVLAGIEEEDWPKIRQCVVEVHDSKQRVEHMQQLFAQKGFTVTIEQSSMLAGTNLYHMYAVRSTATPEKREAFHPVSVEQPALLSAEELRGFLRQIVPDYLIPTTIVFRESLPLTPNGKVDRKALPLVTFDRTVLAIPYEEPTTTTEKQLVDLWAQNLHLQQQIIGIRDNYFNLGGHSLSLMHLLTLIQDHYMIELAVRDIFDHPTVMELAEYIEKIQFVAR